MKWLTFGLLVFLFVLGLVGAANAANPRPVVHLEAGQPAPYSGDLIQPQTGIAAGAAVKKLRTATRKLAEEKEAREIERDAFEAKLERMRIALEASERQKVPAPDEPAFYEHPVFLIAVGVGAGFALGYGTWELFNE